jgi:hypothetical protein
MVITFLIMCLLDIIWGTLAYDTSKVGYTLILGSWFSLGCVNHLPHE